MQIVSGLAMGIDGAGHAGVEAGQETYGVLGCGIDICYPKEISGCLSGWSGRAES